MASNCRAAKLEQETNDLKYKLTHLSSAIADFNAIDASALLHGWFQEGTVLENKGKRGAGACKFDGCGIHPLAPCEL